MLDGDANATNQVPEDVVIDNRTKRGDDIFVFPVFTSPIYRIRSYALETRHHSKIWSCLVPPNPSQSFLNLSQLAFPL